MDNSTIQLQKSFLKLPKTIFFWKLKGLLFLHFCCDIYFNTHTDMRTLSYILLAVSEPDLWGYVLLYKHR